MWSFLIGHLLLISAGVFSKMMHWQYWHPILISGIICLAISWLVIFLEIFMNDIYNRTYWLLSMFVLPTISPAVYMIKRNKLLMLIGIEK